VSIATNPNVKAGLRGAWNRIECTCVAAYLRALTDAVAELKNGIIEADGLEIGDFELLLAFDAVVKDRKRDGSYSAAACKLLMAEFKDTDAAFGGMEEAEAW